MTEPKDIKEIHSVFVARAHHFEVKNYDVVVGKQAKMRYLDSRVAVAGEEVHHVDERFMELLGGKLAALYQYVDVYAYISCRGDDGQLFNIGFLHPDSTDPGNRTSIDSPEGYAFLPAEQFSWYIDLLRYEKPVAAILPEADPNENRLRVLWEPVGEKEI